MKYELVNHENLMSRFYDELQEIAGEQDMRLRSDLLKKWFSKHVKTCIITNTIDRGILTHSLNNERVVRRIREKMYSHLAEKLEKQKVGIIETKFTPLDNDRVDTLTVCVLDFNNF